MFSDKENLINVKKSLQKAISALNKTHLYKPYKFFKETDNIGGNVTLTNKKST